MEYLKELGCKNRQPEEIYLEGDNFIIGKSSFDFLARYAKVSDKHALLLKKNDVWYVKDLTSAQGVYVNSKRIYTETPLQKDNIIGFGGFKLGSGGFICQIKVRSKNSRKKRPVLDSEESKCKNLNTSGQNSASGVGQQCPSVRSKSFQKEVNSSDSSSSPTFSKASRLFKSKSSQNGKKRCRRPRISSSDSSDVGYQTADRFNDKNNSQDKNAPQKFKNSTNRKTNLTHTSSSSECSAQTIGKEASRKESPETVEKIKGFIQSSSPGGQNEGQNFSRAMNKDDLTSVFDSDNNSGSDSSVSCHSFVMYPSKSVTERKRDLAVSSEDSSATESATSDAYIFEKTVPIDGNLLEPANRIETGRGQLLSKNEKECKSVGKTLLIDPKPMQPSSKQRDKNAWLAKRNRSFNCSEKKKKKLTGISEKCKEKSSTVANVSNSEGNLNFEKASRKVTEKDVSNPKPAKSDLQNISKNDKIKEDRTPKKTVPRRRDNFGSRMGFLVNMEENPSVKSKKQESNESNIRINDSMFQNIEVKMPEPYIALDKMPLPSPVPVLSKKDKNYAEELVSSKALKNTRPVYMANASTFKDESKLPVTKHAAISLSSSPDPRLRRIQTSRMSSPTTPQMNCKSLPLQPEIPPDSVHAFNAMQVNSRPPSGEPKILMKSASISNTVKVNEKSSSVIPEISISSLPSGSVEINRKSLPSYKVYNDDKLGENSRFSISRVSNTTSSITSRRSSSELRAKNIKEDFIIKIVHWKIEWLNADTQLMELLPLISGEIVPLSLSYQSVDSYISAVQSMILLEIYDMLHTACIGKEETRNNFLYSAFYCENKCNFAEIHCETIVNDNACYPFSGDVIKMKISTLSREINALGYVSKHKLRSDDTGSKRICAFTVFTQNVQAFLPKENLNASRISSIKRKLNLAEAVECLRTCPLKQDIIGPSSETFAVDLPMNEYNLTFNEVIQSIIDEIQKPSTKHKIILLHGFPGTGKTRAVVNIIEDLFISCVSGKILVAASSDSTINEIGSRLVEVNERSSFRGTRMKFVKIGLMKQNYHKKGKPPDCSSKDSHDVLNFTSKRSGSFSLDREEDTWPMSQYDKLNKRWVFISEKLKTKTLGETNVVLVTKESYEYFTAFKTDMKKLFEYFIVDEASRFTEPDILQMLGPAINTLVLIGDHLESHTVMQSKLASHFGFERSMFERFYAVKDSLNENVITFTEQCRMHPQICYFPSKYYYASKLRSCADLDKRYQFFPSRPYFFCDIMKGEESNDVDDNMKCNLMEAAVVSCLCISIRKLSPEISVGIITNTVGQISPIRNIMHQPSHFKDVEINTVENFQGREKDLIIISCVRTEKPPGDQNLITSRSKLIVALTRARQSLIICGSVNYLKLFPDWNALIQDARERKLCISIPYYTYAPQIFYNKMRKTEIPNIIQ
ncbi:probable helicase senataxin [Stegodyphus dumicola]|uniref:probable helicase senataxin n=1 Tax=Stegodyphus dumicola TaxID=202533 RepID=UPI0015AF7768|nr:probable helicase senataxin [Stegodyphus dumicola]